MKNFFEFKNSADGASAELLIYDEIAAYESFWFDLPNPQSFKAQLNALGKVQNITVRINSPGGDLIAAQAIYSLLRNHEASITTYIDGWAASAASVIAMAGDKRVMQLGSFMMIHNPELGAYGDYRVHDKASEVSKQAQNTLVAVYADRTGIEREEIIRMLENETWLTADDALQMGFATEVDRFAQIAACANGNRAIVNGRDFSIKGFKTIPAALFANGKEVNAEMSNLKNETDEAANAGAAQVDGGDPVVEPEAAAAGADESAAGEPSADAITNALTADRKRVSEIMALSRPGAEKIINDAITNGDKPGDVALKIINSPDVKNAGTLADMRADAPNVAAAHVEASAEDKKIAAASKLAGFANNARRFIRGGGIK